MAAAEVPNEVRFEAYHALAQAFFSQTHHPVRAATMMLDVRFPEVPRAFAAALVSAASRHPRSAPSAPMGRAVGVAIEEVLTRTTVQAFGASARDAVPSWFLQNYEYFFSELLREVLALFDRCGSPMDGKPASPAFLRRVFATVFEMCGGARHWLSLDCLAASTRAHAVLAVCNHCAADRLDLRAPASIHRVVCMDELARRVLAEDPASRDVLNAQRAFGYYAGSERWRGFAAQCACWIDASETRWVFALESEVHAAYAALRERSQAALKTMLKRKRAWGPEPGPGPEPEPELDEGGGGEQASPPPSPPPRAYLTPPGAARAPPRVSGPFSQLLERLGLA
jgi:hypothetical protein